MCPKDKKGNTEEKLIYFVGTNLGHAISNQIHDIIAKELTLNWRFHPIDNASLEEFSTRLHEKTFAGAVVTIPHKIGVMAYLDRIDNMASIMGACNNIYTSADGDRVGTNTDWIGVRDSLLALAERNKYIQNPESMPGFGQPAFVVGAGGASRAAVYALHTVFGASKIYIINRDEKEVEALIEDSQRGYSRAALPSPSMVHLQTIEEAMEVEGIFYGVGTVPDFEPVTKQEINAKMVLEQILSGSNGVFLDMCYKPRLTRNLQAANRNGWVTGDGGQVVGWQLKAQWEFWAGKDISDLIPTEAMMNRVYDIVQRLP